MNTPFCIYPMKSLTICKQKWDPMSIPSCIYLLSSCTSCWQQYDETPSAYLSACKHMSRSCIACQPIYEAGSVCHFAATRPNHRLSVGWNTRQNEHIILHVSFNSTYSLQEKSWGDRMSPPFCISQMRSHTACRRNMMGYNEHTFLHPFNQITYNLSE